uniref:L-histidine N(alpha)-methyltransferase n=1 Tax=Calothrix sp. PCC 6303 TaxID=1170562 RepID=UPI001EEFCCEA|nr:L-histidine N(alpha)-methyltransferase [Calothrix sp. PCC 6303]
MNNHQTKYLVKPSEDFYSPFSEAEITNIIQTLETRREIPLKYSYKGRGAKIWNNYYMKYIVTRWYRRANLENSFLKANLSYIDGTYQNCEKVNIIDIGSGNSHPIKELITQLNKTGKINKYIALDISDSLLQISQKNFSKWFPNIDYTHSTIDIENGEIDQELLKSSTNIKTANIFLHLGVTIGNHQNRIQVFKNLRNSMSKKDLLIFTNEIGSNSQWDGFARGAYKYQAEQIYKWIKDKIGILSQDCELIRKYDLPTDSIVANIKFKRHYTINFSRQQTSKKIHLLPGDEITIWRHHKCQMSELTQEMEQAGLKLVHHTTNQYQSHVMVICQISEN